MFSELVVKEYSDISRDNISCKIIPFPVKRGGVDTVPKTTSFGLINSKDKITKESIETIIYEILINEKRLSREQDINPFGSIYLCDLEPDKVDHAVIEKIKMFAEIKDLSDSISFNDGLDD